MRGLFISIGATEKIATLLARLTCHQGKLPQGAPTSPVISNMICARMDRELIQLAKELHCRMTRYVDDITFSKKQSEISTELAFRNDDGKVVVGRRLREIIETNGFKVNDSKVWLFSNKKRQMVTGLVVNERCNTTRQFPRQIRAMIHAWKKFGQEAAHTEHVSKHYRRRGRIGEPPQFKDVLLGKLAYLGMVKGISDPVYKNLQKQLASVFPEYIRIMKKENDETKSRDFFICHASDDKTSIVRPLAEELIKSGAKVWYDEYEIMIGDSLREKIDDGLLNSKFGIIVLSEAFFQKEWTKKELNGLVALATNSTEKKILPILHGIDLNFLLKKSPTLSDIHHLRTDNMSLADINRELIKVLQHSNK